MAAVMKRKIAEIESLDMAKCLILLSHTLQEKPMKSMKNDDVFECRTCNKKFSSFQALGGHRASHKKPRLIMVESDNNNSNKGRNETEKEANKMHKCTICGAEFALGQALGGHMRKHRAAAMAENFSSSMRVSKLPVLRRTNSSKRVFGLDLNLTPLENDLEYLFGKMAPKVGSNFI